MEKHILTKVEAKNYYTHTCKGLARTDPPRIIYKTGCDSHGESGFVLILSRQGNIFVNEGQGPTKIGTVAREEFIKKFTDFFKHVFLSFKNIPNKNSCVPLSALCYSVTLIGPTVRQISWHGVPPSKSLDYFIKRLLEETIIAISNMSQQHKKFRRDKAQFNKPKDHTHWHACP